MAFFPKIHDPLLWEKKTLFFFKWGASGGDPSNRGQQLALMSDSKYRGGLTWMVKKQYRLTNKEMFGEFYMYVYL